MENIKVNYKDVLLDNFLGCNAVYHGYGLVPDDAGRELKKEQLLSELDLAQKIKLGIARSYFTCIYSYNKETKKIDFDTPSMKAYYFWFDECKKRNIDVAINLGWDCVGTIEEMMEMYNVSFEEGFEKYGEWGVAFVSELIKRGHDNVKYGLLTTEPDGHPREGFDVPDLYKVWGKMAKSMHEHLLKAGLRDKIKLVGPDVGGASYTHMVELVRNEYDECCDIYASHDYAFNWTEDRDTYPEWVFAMECGKKFTPKEKQYWFDEYGLVHWGENEAHFAQELRWYDGLYGLHLAFCGISALNNAVSTTLLWTLYDQQFPDWHFSSADSFTDGFHRCGCVRSAKEGLVPYPCYYAFSLMSRYLGKEGTKVFKTDFEGSVRCGAVLTETGDYAIIVASHETEDRAFKVNLPKTDKKFHRHLYVSSEIKPNEKAEIIKSDKEFSGNTLEDVLPPMSFAIYTTEE